MQGGRILADGELIPKQVLMLEEDACFNIYHPVIAKRREALRQKRMEDKKTNKAVMYHKPQGSRINTSTTLSNKHRLKFQNDALQHEKMEGKFAKQLQKAQKPSRPRYGRPQAANYKV